MFEHHAVTRRIAAWFAPLAVALALSAQAGAAELPDFTELVGEQSAAVVNISTVRQVQTRQRFSDPREGGEMDEFFRRFFPPPRERGGNASGSGFIISKDGYLLTNYHVVANASEIKVRLNDRRELDATVIGTDRRSDLALLKVGADNLPTVQFGKSEDLKVGEWVLAIGSPFGFDYSVTAGIVSAKGRSLPTAQNENYVPFIQTDVAINPGNSGGPLFNLDGEVVGINSQIYSNSGGFMGVSFAIPIDVAMEVVDQLRENGRVSRGWLGVVIQEVDRELAESFGLDRPGGALVNRVLEGSPAEQGGLQTGDIITKFNGQDIDLSGELPHYVGRAPANSVARLEVVRDGEKTNMSITIGELPGGESAADPVDTSVAGLGISVEPLSDQTLDRMNLNGGVRVIRVTGAAEESGLRRGDVIVRLNNSVIGSVADFDRISQQLEKGKPIPVLVRRGETNVFLALRVPE